MSRSLRAVALAVVGLALWSLPARAETQISVYGGVNGNFGSDVRVNAPGVSLEQSVDWDGKSFEMPPYWGVRGTYWLSKSSNWGLAIDYTHTKAVAELDSGLGDTFNRLEFTDGNNLLFLEVLHRFNPMWQGALVPYVGAGVGVTIPHVEVTLKTDPPNRTFEYQLAGPAAQILAGLEYKLNESWSLFSEAKLSYSHISADLDGGGRFETDLWSPQLAIGVTYRIPSN
ncbi:MAG TPA: outer membrane beta-barrel protein [Hyphomicrobiaceae bacterium]|jgi:lipid A oxidase|nr:outer membrane beta-barrel protein [Hyphomicrobiaceae bacterium]